MYQSDKNEGDSDVKRSASTPLLSKMPKGASKIFILTPEILNNLGLRAHLGIRKTGCDEPKNTSTNSLDLEKCPVVGDLHSNTSYVEFEEEAASGSSGIKKRKRPYNSLQKKEEPPETPQSVVKTSLIQGSKFHSTTQKTLKDLENKEESISSILKAKKIRRQNDVVNPANNQKEESTKKKACTELIGRPDNPVSTMGKSKLLAKPRKLKDYIMTNPPVNKHCMSKNVDSLQTSEKRQSRKSSVKSTTGKPTASSPSTIDEREDIKSSKMQTLKERARLEKIRKHKNIKSQKMLKLIDESDNSPTTKRLSIEDNSVDLPETQICIDKTQDATCYKRRNSREQKTSNVVAQNTEIISTNKNEPGGKGNLKPIMGHHNKTVKSHKEPKIKDEVISEHIEMADKLKFNRKSEPVSLGEDTLKTKIISVTKEMATVVLPSQSHVSQIELVASYRKPLTEEIINGKRKEQENVKTLKSKSSIPRSSDVTRFILDKEKEPKSHVAQSVGLYPNIENAKTPKSDIMKRMHAKEVRVAKPILPRSRVEKKPTATKSNLLRSPEKLKHTNPSESQNLNETNTLKPKSGMSQDDSKKINALKNIPQKSLHDKEEALSIPCCTKTFNETPELPAKQFENTIPNLSTNNAKTRKNFPDIGLRNKIPPTSLPSLNVKNKITLINSLITEDYTIDVMEKNKAMMEGAPMKRSGKVEHSTQGSADLEPNMQLQNIISIQPITFNTVVEALCRLNNSVQANKIDTDAKSTNPPISNVNEKNILFNSPITEDLIKVNKVVPAEIPSNEIMKTPVIRKTRGSQKPKITMKVSADLATHVEAGNVTPTPATAFDTLVETACRLQKSAQEKQDENDQESDPSLNVIEKGGLRKSSITEDRTVKNELQVDEGTHEQDPSTEILDSQVRRKKGRPRKSRISNIIAVDQEMKMQMGILISAPSTTVDAFAKNTCRTKKAVQRSKDETDGEGLSDGDSDKDEIVLKRCRGRPPGAITQGSGRKRGRGRGRGRGRERVDFEYSPRERSSGKPKVETEESKKVFTLEEPQVAITPLVQIECGKCKEKIAKKNWPAHNLSRHNDMGWLNNEKEPDFANNEKLLRSVLMAALKKKKRKDGLICETCGAGKRSANGFISHLQFCGKTEEERQALLVACPICGNVMMPSSIDMHERSHRQTDAALEEQKKNATSKAGTSGREKRKAAERAATKISEFTDILVKDEPAQCKNRRREELSKFIEKPRHLKGAPNRWRGIWKGEISVNGKALCRQPGCAFSGTSVEAMCEHNSTCPCTPRANYVCKICKFSSLNENDVWTHVKAQHDEERQGEQQGSDCDFEHDNGASSNESDSERPGDNEKSPSFSTGQLKFGQDKRERQKANVKFLDEEVQIDPKFHTMFSPAIRWTMEFEYKNYRLRLFEDLSPNAMKLLNDEDAVEYLPELSSSIRVTEAKKRKDSTSTNWRNWQRFEGRTSEGGPRFFTGGPIWALAWLPIPAPLYDKFFDQYVAISTHPSMESVYVVGKSYVGKNLIQIWRLGPLQNSTTTEHVDPVLAYGIAHDKGTIWCLEWCPSGCYEHSSFFDDDEIGKRKDHKRMGLLAAACSDGCVHIFSLPFPDELNFTKSSEGTNCSLPIYTTKPVITLVASTAMYEKGEQNWQCTKLHWGKELGHDTIIAGFSNGYAAIWDLNSESLLFLTKREETTLIDAFHHFYAHGHAVSFVQVVPYGGKRFFITAGYDRMTKVWDLEDMSYPLSMTKKGIALDGAWLNHWPGYLTAYDDVMVHGHTYHIALRQPGPKGFPLLPTNSTTFSVDVSDYGNSVGHGTLAGEVLVMFPHHLWHLRDMERDLPRKRWLASSTDVIDIAAEESERGKSINTCLKKKMGKDYVYMPETYKECQERFGIVFHDNLTRSKGDGHRKLAKPPCSERMAAVQVEQYPFASVNRVSWNPNAWSYLWLCVGYQNGLVRFLNFNAVAVDRELRKQLPIHAESMFEPSRRTYVFKTDNDS